METDTLFGKFEIADRDVWTTIAPLPGFPELERFALIDVAQFRPFVWLQAIDSRDICFPLAAPREFNLKYPEIPARTLFGADANNATLLIMTVLRNQEGQLRPIANKRAPLCFEIERRLLAQWILPSDRAIEVPDTMDACPSNPPVDASLRALAIPA